MLNSIAKKLTGKEIILFQPHRNSNPLLNDRNRGSYLFLNPYWIIKFTGLFGRNSRRRYRIFAAILSIIDPLCIIDINWTARYQHVYLTWCKKRGKKFIVIQHGAYFAGVMHDIKEKYIGCNVFLVWGEHFKQLFERNNPGKAFECIVYGNPIYNDIDRTEFQYSEKTGTRILVAVSVIKGSRLKKLNTFLRQLSAFGFEVTVKEHNFQEKLSDPIDGYHKTNKSLYAMLKTQAYDIVLTDVSSAMLDTILYKNRVIYFSPEGEDPVYTDNVYERFLINVAASNRAETIQSIEDLYKYVNIDAQERLLQNMAVTSGMNNSIAKIFDSIEPSAPILQEQI